MTSATPKPKFGSHTLKNDFSHHASTVARLNHGSFGAPPKCVLDEQQKIREQYYAQPDAFCFADGDKSTVGRLLKAKASVLKLLVNGESTKTESKNGGKTCCEDPKPSPLYNRVALLQNAATAAAITCWNWKRTIDAYVGELFSSFQNEKDSFLKDKDATNISFLSNNVLATAQARPAVFYLDIIYQANLFCFEEYLTSTGGHTDLVCLNITKKPGVKYYDDGSTDTSGESNSMLGFPETQAEMLKRFKASLDFEKKNNPRFFNNKDTPVFAMFDMISSQPAFKLPMVEMVAEFRKTFPNSNVCVDGAHVLGSYDNFDVVKSCGDPDYFFSNLNKWAFAIPATTVFYAKTEQLMANTKHVIPSWLAKSGLGLADSCLWTGTRDYSHVMAVPKAVEYLSEWRSSDGKNAQKCMHEELCKARDLLCEKWGTKEEFYPQSDSFTTMCMVKLPFNSLSDRPGPGMKEDSLRGMLRNQYNVEASISHFDNIGTFVRLSFAVYNTMEDVERLGNAVLEVMEKRKKSMAT